MEPTINESEKRQARESLSGAFDDLVQSNLLLVKAIQDAVPVIKKASPSAHPFVTALITLCAVGAFAMSTATYLTIRSIRDDNQALIVAITEACPPKEANPKDVRR